jgi:hypothetical protein
MQRRMQTRQITMSSAASSQTRIGSGTTEQTNTWKDLISHPPSTTPLTNPCRDRPDGFPPTGKTFWWDHDDAVAERAPRRQISLDNSGFALRSTIEFWLSAAIGLSCSSMRGCVDGIEPPVS